MLDQISKYSVGDPHERFHLNFMPSLRHLYFLLFILFLSACSSSTNYKVPEYEKMADRITAITARKIEMETGLRLCGIGGGAINCIRKLNMSFNCFNERGDIVTVIPGEK